MNRFPLKKTGEKRKIQVIDASKAIIDSDASHPTRKNVGGDLSRKRRRGDDDEEQNSTGSRMSSALNVSTARRVDAAFRAAKSGDKNEFVELQSQIQELAVEKMTKKEKKKYMDQKFKDIGGVVKTQKGNMKVMIDLQKKYHQKEVDEYKQKKLMGIGGTDPDKLRKEQKEKAEFEKKKRDPFSKGLDLQVGNYRKDGSLNVSSRDRYNVGKQFRKSKKDGIRMDKVFKR